MSDFHRQSEFETIVNGIYMQPKIHSRAFVDVRPKSQSLL
jgi:hypothetical protein